MRPRSGASGSTTHSSGSGAARIRREPNESASAAGTRRSWPGRPTTTGRARPGFASPAARTRSSVGHALSAASRSYSPPVDIVPEPIERYAEEHTTPPEPLLAELARETRETLESPQMLTGTVEGRLLELLVYASGAKRVLELGTYSGYSALSMAAGLPPGGRIDTCELDESRAAVARRYIEQSPYTDRIQIHLGPALESIERLEGDFDFVFIDADKPNYVNYYEAVLPRLTERGFIAADNTLWSGRVLEEEADEEGTRAIKAFNEHVKTDPRVTSVMLTVRDGITLIRPRGGT